MLAKIGASAGRKPAQLDWKVESVLIQFKIGDPRLMPSTLAEIGCEQKTANRGVYGPGMLFIQESLCPAVGIRAFLFELAEAGFKLGWTHLYKTDYGHEIQFVFGREGNTSPAELCRLNQCFEPALQFLSRLPWRVHAYSNPHLSEKDMWGMSIICRAPEGPGAPKKFLRIVDSKVVLE